MVEPGRRVYCGETLAMKKTSGVVYSLPLFLWTSLFFVIPIAIILVFSVLKRGTYGGVIWELSPDGFAALGNPSFIKTTMVTIFIALVSTALTILVALPASYYIARTKDNVILLVLVIIPFWVNFIIRVFAWMAVLGRQGFLNDVLLSLGIIQEPIQFLFNLWAVIIVHVYTYLPYAILPLYSAIEKFDFNLLEAGRDLGASHMRSLRSILLPNIRSGLITAILFTFIPTLGSYAIPDLVGGKDGYMLGNSIAYYIGTANNWPRASAISVVLTAITGVGLLIYALYNQNQAKQVIAEES